MAVAVGLMMILLLLVHPIVSVMSTPLEAVTGTVVYLTVCFIGIPCITAYNIISSIFRGIGDSKKSDVFYCNCVCGEYRAGLSVYGIFTPWSGWGCAWYYFVAACECGHCTDRDHEKGTGISLSAKDFRPDHRFMKKILNIGIPVALQDGFIQVAFIVITVIANRRGLDTAAAVGIVEKIISFLFLVPSSMLSTVSALCAQNIGARKHERASRTLRYGILIAAGFGVIVAVVIQFVAGPVVSLFTSDATVVVLGSQYIRGYIFDCIFAGVSFLF